MTGMIFPRRFITPSMNSGEFGTRVSCWVAHDFLHVQDIDGKLFPADMKSD
jgi:hypothetical protein